MWERWRRRWTDDGGVDGPAFYPPASPIENPSQIHCRHLRGLTLVTVSRGRSEKKLSALARPVGPIPLSLARLYSSFPTLSPPSTHPHCFTNPCDLPLPKWSGGSEAPRTLLNLQPSHTRVRNRQKADGHQLWSLQLNCSRLSRQLLNLLASLGKVTRICFKDNC